MPGIDERIIALQEQFAGFVTRIEALENGQSQNAAALTELEAGAVQIDSRLDALENPGPEVPAPGSDATADAAPVENFQIT